MGSEITNSQQVRALVEEAMAAIITRIILRRDLAANWVSAGTVLEEGEMGFEVDSRALKIGDGSTDWESLDYMGVFVWGTPASATAPGKRGMCMFDASYAYFCVADNAWRRVALAAGW